MLEAVRTGRVCESHAENAEQFGHTWEQLVVVVRAGEGPDVAWSLGHCWGLRADGPCLAKWPVSSVGFWPVKRSLKKT